MGTKLIVHRKLIIAGRPLMSRNACNGENGETGEKSPASGDLNWMPKVAPRKLAILAKMAILAILAKKEKNERETLVIVKASFSQELNHAFRNRF